MPVPRPLRVGVDIGGTFTDVCILDRDGIVAVGKTLTTPSAPAVAVEDVLRETLERHHLNPADVESLVHGTTLVTNALIERRGAKTALLTTEGFRDVIEMGREHRYELYDLDIELPRPLVPRHLRFGVPERTLADGTISIDVSIDYVQRVARELVEHGVEAVAICFLHSHVNDSNEADASQAIFEVAPELRVALSSEVNPEIREYERFSTTLANVYVEAIVETYLKDLRARLRRIGVPRDPLIMLSNGGVATLDVARRFPIRMLESGPAGGALGAVSFGLTHGTPDLMAFDMGGTTAKLCIIEDHRPLVTHTFEVDRLYRMRAGSGLPVRAPVIDMIEIGAGGGSVAQVGALGLITVGPQSAGSDPGPVSYGHGGDRCTVTDADLVLGYLAADRFLGGAMTLDAAAAADAIWRQVAEPMGITVEEAAWGIHATVNENMANAARVHAIERGQDPGKLSMFVSGGNGPLHGPGVAQSLGSPSVIVPPAAGVLSSLGFLSAPISIDLVRSSHAELESVDLSTALEWLGSLRSEGEKILVESGVPVEVINHEHGLDMRFIGQGAEISVPVPGGGRDWKERVGESFLQQYQRRFGNVVPDTVGIEILTWRVTSRGPDPQAQLRLGSTADAEKSLVGHRDAYFADCGFLRAEVHNRYRMAVGTVVDGPALVEENESTLVVAPNARCRVRADGSLLVRLDRRGQQ